MDQQDTQPDDAGAATDAATLNSDAAVVEGGQQLLHRREDEPPTPPPPQEAAVMNHNGSDPAAAGAGFAGETNAQARRRHHYHYRKRTFSSATASETNPSTNVLTSDNNNAFSGLSLMQNSDALMSAAGDSIVTFGLNFHFDNTSSPSNSDSGEGEGTKKKKTVANCSTEKKPAAKPTTMASPNNSKEGLPPEASGSNEGKNSKGSSSNKCSNKAAKSSNKASPSGNGGEDGFDPNSSDSSLNNGSGGSENGGDSNSGSGSGGDGSGGSGWKSTISSLTTSSNQEWLATNESAAAAAAVTAGGTGAVANTANGDTKVSAKEMESDGKAPAVSQDTTGGKKRKVDATKGEDDDGYKTDEEQWGGNKGGNPCTRLSASHSHKGALKVSVKKSDGPPVKQARFSIDQHPSAVARTDDSAQQPVSSLTGSSGTDSASAIPVVTSSSGTRTPHHSSTSTPATSTFAINALSAAGQNPGAPNPVTSAAKRGTKQITSTDPSKREQRNAREKERSCRIARQIDDLRTLLSRGGVIVAKGTKSSVLSEAANYINLLQQQQVQWEIDRQSLLQQMQQIGSAPLNQGPSAQLSQTSQPGNTIDLNSISPNDYKFVFNNSSLGMAIASMGGAFVDCNAIFCQLSEYTKEEVCSMTIFNMTARTDLQHAFDLISQMITPPSVDDSEQNKSNTIVLRGAMKNRSDLGLSVSLVKGDLGIAKCFCVTLVKILSMECHRPDTVSIEMELPPVSSKHQNIGFGVSPAYTSG